MDNEAKKGPVRVRQRIGRASGRERIVADRSDTQRKKRLPNSGSMKKGETRNPNGRPKGAKGTKAMIKKVLSEKTSVREGGRSRKVTLYHALLLKEVQMAFDGDWRARKTVIELGRWALPEENPLAGKPAAAVSSAADDAILSWFEGELRAGLGADNAE